MDLILPKRNQSPPHAPEGPAMEGGPVVVGGESHSPAGVP